MEVKERIEVFKEFIEKNYLTSLTNNIRKGQSFLKIDFDKLSEFNPEIALLLLDQPQDTIKTIEIAIGDMDIEDCPDNIQIQIIKLPKSQEVKINRLRSKHIGKMIFTQGVVMTRTKVYPEIISAEFECPSCGTITRILQLDNTFKEPSFCSCGRKGKFRIVSKILKDIITIKLAELPERLIGSEQPNNVRVMLQGALCNKDFDIHLGARVEVVGYVEEIPLKAGHIKSTSCDFLFHALSYTNLETVSFDTKLSKDEEALFEDIKASKNPARFISKLIFPDIHGCRKSKEAIIYQQFGGTTYRGRRDYIHILLYGDPATAKTDLALKVSAINPISKISTGTNISNVGLTVSAKKDELTGNWMAVAGLLPMCNNGLAVIDEIEKMGDNDKRGLHTPMEHGFAPINKAGISAKLVANTSILATSNQKVVGKPLKVVSNLDLPSPIIDRFDLIFTFKDIPERKTDLAVATKLTERATFEHNGTTFGHSSTTFGGNGTTFEHNGTTFYLVTLKKYIYLSKAISPKLSRRVIPAIHKWYIGLRNASAAFEYDEKKPSPRVVESVLRMARAITRSKMKDTITQKELQLAMTYFDFVYDKDNNPQVVEENISEEKEEVAQEEKEVSGINPKKYASGMAINSDVRLRGDKGFPRDEFIKKYTKEKLKRLLSKGDLVENKAGFLRVGDDL